MWLHTLGIIHSKCRLTFFQDKQSTVVPILKINVFAVLRLIVCARMRYTQFSNFMQWLL